ARGRGVLPGQPSADRAAAPAVTSELPADREAEPVIRVLEVRGRIAVVVLVQAHAPVVPADDRAPQRDGELRAVSRVLEAREDRELRFELRVAVDFEPVPLDRAEGF